MVRNIGADYIVDYKHEDITKSQKKYDVIIAVNGYHPLSAYKNILNKGGTFIFVGGTTKAIMSVFGILFHSIGSKKFKASAYPFLPKIKYLSDLRTFAEKGKLQPHIDKVCNPQDISEALRYIVQDHAQGKVVINLGFH
jgi:NADPH:quinone reductase-like Zn-dependent oxidoreductase